MRAGRVLLLIVAALVVTGVAQAGPPRTRAKAKPRPTQKLKPSTPSGRATVKLPAAKLPTAAKVATAKVPWSEVQITAQLDARLKAFYAADAALRAGLARARQQGRDTPALRRKYSELYARLLRHHNAAVATLMQRMHGAQGYPCRADGSCVEGLTCIFGRCQLAHDAPHRGPGPKKRAPLPPRPKRRSPPR